MPVEIAGLLEQMEHKTARRMAGMDFYTGEISGVPCAVSCCWPGKVNAAACAQAMITVFGPALVINSGVAGGIGESVQQGDLVLAERLVEHDMDTTATGEPKGFVTGPELVYFPADARALAALREAAAPIYPGGVHVGTVATGDQFIGSNQKMEALRAEFGAIACEMEGAAVAHVCYLNGVPCAVLRTISDNGDDNAAFDFEAFAGEAAAKSTRLLAQLLPRLHAEFPG